MGFTKICYYVREPVDDYDGPDVAVCEALVRARLAAASSVTLDELYSDPSSPGDLPLYAAVERLRARGEIRGPAVSGDHRALTYTRA